MAELKYDKEGRLLFTKEMKNEYTLLLPMMAPIHFNIMKNVFIEYGYNAVLLDTKGPEIAQTGLKYVHNDTCYPALLVIGQFIHALNSGEYDPNKTALVITQTGGGCRASNYIHLLRKALKKSGYENVPVVSLNLAGLEKNSGFKITIPMVRKLFAALVYGDVLMLLNNQVKPYELVSGQSHDIVEKWINILTQQFRQGNGYKKPDLRENIRNIVSDFASVVIHKTPKVKVGVVGEIYVKYSDLGNNGLEQFLEEQDCEVFVPGIMNFIMFFASNGVEEINLYGGSKVKRKLLNALMGYLTDLESMIIEEISKYNKFVAPSTFEHTRSLAKDVIGYGAKMGEGWLLTAEMLELVEQGYENIVCTQPFGCLPNHICGKGMIRKIKSINEKANIVAIDYDPGATKVNQENRIRLMLSIAKENLPKETPIRRGVIEKEQESSVINEAFLKA